MINRYDLVYSFNRLLTDYRFSFTVILIMALGLAVSLFLFPQVYSMGFKALPFEQGDRIVSIARQEPTYAHPIGGLSQYEVKYFLDNQSTLDQYSVFELSDPVNVATKSQAENFLVARVAGDFFSLLGINAQIGRVLTPNDHRPGSPTTVVISDDAWLKLFQRDSNAIGKSLKISGHHYVIVGVMPKGFSFPIKQDLWISFNTMNVTTPNGQGWLTAIGLLKPGINQQDAQEDFKQLSKEVQHLYPIELRGKGIHLNSLPKAFANENKMIINAMIIVTLAILIMSCISITKLLLVRILEQKKETMIRLALGLPKWRITAIPLLESFWLCLVSGALGTALCALGIKFYQQQTYNASGPFWWSIKIDASFWLASATFVGVIWLITSITPTIMSFKTPSNTALSGGRKGGTGSTSNTIMGLLASAQITCSFFLITITSLALFNFIKITNADYGIDIKGLISAEISLSDGTYNDINNKINYFETLQSELLALNEVKNVSVISTMPGRTISYGVTYRFINDSESTTDTLQDAGSISADHRALSNLSIPVLEGRGFNEFDTQESERVTIINESFAKMLWPNQSAVGQALQIDPDKNGPIVTIIGVVKDIAYGMPTQRNKKTPIFYRPITQDIPFWNNMHIGVNVKGNLNKSIPKIKASARKVDSQIPLQELMTHSQKISQNATNMKRLVLNFFPAALLALIITAAGIYGLSARLILQSTSDIGIMQALGARDRHITSHFMKKSIVQLLLGIITGLSLLLLVLPKLLGHFDISRLAFSSFALLIIFLITTTVLLASYIPLHRVVRFTPQAALNEENRHATPH